MRNAYLGQTFYVDTNIIIFAVETGNPWRTELGELISAIDNKAIRACTSELTLAEALTKPLAAGSTALVSKYEQTLAEDGVIDVVPINRQILRTAAEFCGRLGIKLADAIHLATAKYTGCDVILTNDLDLGRKAQPDFKWLTLADLSPSNRNV
jgi:predicted nucleic acid-binding protein